MVVIQRSQYMNFLKQFKDMTDTVKVLTGIRRSGKTFLMNMFINYLKIMVFLTIKLFILILKTLLFQILLLLKICILIFISTKVMIKEIIYF